MKNKALTSFNALAINEQTIMLALAVIYAPIGQSSLQNMLRTTGCFPTNTVALIDKNLREKLQERSLIILTQDGWHCSEDISEPLMRLAILEPWFTKLSQLLIAEPSYYYPARISVFHAIKQLRIFLYQGNELAFAANIEHFYIDYQQIFPSIINKIFFNDYDAEWFASLSDDIKFLVLKYYLQDSYLDLSNVDDKYQLLESFFGAKKHANIAIVHALVEQRLVRGNFKDVEYWLADDLSADGLTLLATLRFLQNCNDEAIQLFHVAIKALKKETGKRNVCIE